MVWFHIFLRLLRYAGYVAVALLLLFAGYLATIALVKGYDAAEVSLRSLPDGRTRVDAERAERRAVKRHARAAAEVDAAETDRAEAEVAVETASRAKDGLSERTAETWQAALLAEVELKAAAQVLGFASADVPESPEAFRAWLARERHRMTSRCTFGLDDFVPGRPRQLVFGRLSGACAAAERLFARLEAAGRSRDAAVEAAEQARLALQQATESVEQARADLARATAARQRAESRVSELDRQLAAARATAAELARDGRARRWLSERWGEFWRWGLLVLAVLWAGPYVFRALVFHLVGPVVERARPLRFDNSRHVEPDGPATSISWEPSERTARATLDPGQRIVVRPDHLRQVPSGSSRTRWLLPADRRGFSWLLGFFGWTEVAVPQDTGDGRMTLTIAPTGRDAADRYVMRVDLVNHPGLVIVPHHVVALSGGLTLFARWSFGAHALMMGQVRYVHVRGTGSIWLSGFGDVVGDEASPRESHQDRGAYLAWDSRMDARLRRRETAWPFIRGQVNLFELGVRGEGALVWQKAIAPTGQSLVERTAGAFWSALGKLLGF